MNMLYALYERDFQAWLKQHVDLLRQGRLQELDISHLIDELLDMGKQNQRELASHFIILLGHLLKWEFQPSMRSRTWKRSIDEQREQVDNLLEDNPSLKPLLPEAVAKAYPRAVKLASKETHLPLKTFPAECHYSLAQITDDNFWPGME